MLATTPSGMWVMRSRMPPSSNTSSSRIALAQCSMKKSMRGSRPFSSLRACAIGLPISIVSVWASASSSATTPARKRRITASRSSSGRAAQAGWAARAAVALAATLALSSAFGAAISSPVAGLWICSVVMVDLNPCAWRVRPPESRCSIGASSKVPCARVVELGVPLHGGHDSRRRAGAWPRSCRPRGSAPRRRNRAPGP